MTLEDSTLDEEIIAIPDEDEEYSNGYLRWTPVVAGAFAATAFSWVLLTFGIGIGLGVSSTSPTWRDASAVLALLSGIYLILQALLSFGFGGYLAGRIRRHSEMSRSSETERRDGIHGLSAWALAVLLGAALAVAVGTSAINHASPSAMAPNTTSAEPLLSYELDKLLRSTSRPANVNINEARAEAGRILMTSSSHSGVSADDRNYLVQQVAATTGVSATDAQHRVDASISDARTAIARSRRSTTILAFSIAAATLLGAAAAWSAAVAGGRHRDGEPLPGWMDYGNRARRPGLAPR